MRALKGDDEAAGRRRGVRFPIGGVDVHRPCQGICRVRASRVAAFIFDFNRNEGRRATVRQAETARMWTWGYLLVAGVRILAWFSSHKIEWNIN